MKLRAFVLLAGLIAAAPLSGRAIAQDAAPAKSSAQSSETIRGHVLGPDGKPLAGQEVVLHRVTGANGLTVATSKSDATGAFALNVANPDVSADAVYFLAARYNSELYLGDAFKAPFDTAARHTVQVGIAATSARALMAGGATPEQTLPTPPPPPDPTRWLIWIMPALALVALAVMLFGARGRIPARRRILAEIARLDEAQTDKDDTTYNASRAALLAKLRTPAEV